MTALFTLALFAPADCIPEPASQYAPAGFVCLPQYGEGIASTWGGPGAARNDCVFPWTSCPPITITAHDTGRSVTVTPSMWCMCYVGTVEPNGETARIVDLGPELVAALGLPGPGLWKVRVEPAGASVLPDTRYTSMVGVSDESDTIPRGPGSVLTPQDRGHCVGETPGVRR